MKAVQLLINSGLPEELRNYNQSFDIGSINKILNATAKLYPDRTADVIKHIADTGRMASYKHGATMTLKDLVPVIDRKPIYAQMDAEIKSLNKRDPEYKSKKFDIYQKYNTFIEKETAKVALGNRNNIAMAVLSGARGKNPQLKAMLSTPGTYSDYKDQPIDLFIKESFSEGIRPAALLAGSHGARASVISTKCLHEDTEVRMADLSVKKIKDIVPGDMVLGADKSGKTFPVKVLNLFDQGTPDCFEYHFGGTRVTCTGNHKFLTYDKVSNVTEVKTIEDAFQSESGFLLEGGYAHIEIAIAKKDKGPQQCYDIEVDHPDHLFVLANHMIVSNSSTAKGGDLAKQLAAVAADMVIRTTDCGCTNGRSLASDDESLRGRFLAHDVGGYAAGTLLDKNVIKALQKSKVKNVIARSPLTCEVPNGLCSKCVGRLYKGSQLPKVGDAVGLIASSASAEPVTQMALCLHENTHVRMAGAKVKQLKDIKIGDKVLGANVAGDSKIANVINVYNQGIKKVNRYYLTGGNVIECTEDHKFLNEVGKILPIKHLKYIKGTMQKLYKITKVEPLGDLNCMDIEVDNKYHLFVLANGIITSNSAKHTAGMTKAKNDYSGLEYIQQFTQSPEVFKDRAPVAQEDGTVTDIYEAPQGGKYVVVNSEKHYVLPGHDINVQKGTKVEAGDQLADGLVDPEDVIKLKGLGAGRLYYADRLNKILSDSGAGTDKRNTEVLARAAIRHVKIDNDEGLGAYLPDDVADYNALQKSYEPSPDSTESDLTNAVGKFLQKPSLHYSIGTRVTPSVVKTLKDAGVNSVLAANTAPEFSPMMVRLRTSSHTNPDWMASLGTSYLTKQLNESATRGDDTNVEHNADYRPRLAIGVDFAKDVDKTGLF